MTRRLALSAMLAAVVIIGMRVGASSVPAGEQLDRPPQDPGFYALRPAEIGTHPDPPDPPTRAGIARAQDDPRALVFAGGALGNMTYHFGPVQHTQKIFTIFWNPG